MKRRRKKNYVQFLLNRVRRKDASCDLTVDDITIPETCPVLGIPLIVEVGNGRSDNTPSIDRVDNRLGYVKDNIVIVSWRANRLKSDATPDELRRLAKYYG